MNRIKKFFYYFLNNDYQVTPVNTHALYIGIILLLIAGIRVYYNIYDYMDIVYGDEAVYMKIGLNIAEDFNRDWGPLYCLWYKFLSLFFNDTITLYYFNFAFVAIVTTLLIYIAFIFLDIHPLVALYFAFCFISSKAVVPLWPRISLFTISILLIGIIIMSRMTELYMRLLVFSTFLLLACYARPEMYVSFILSVIVFGFYLIISKLYLQKRIWVTIALFSVTMLLLHAIFLFPSNVYAGYPRSLAAFYQHFLINRFFEGLSTEYDWVYWKDVHQLFFKESKSIFEIILNYPDEFFWHVWMNTKRYFLEIILKNLSVIFPFFLGKNKLLIAGSLSVFVISIIFIYLKNVRFHFILLIKKYFYYVVILFIWGFPTIISSIIIFPREHYVMLNYFLCIIPLSLLFTSFLRILNISASVNKMFVMALIIIPFLSSCKYYSFFLTDKEENNMCSRKALLHIKNKTLEKNVKYTFFADIHCFVGFLPNNFKEINTIFDKTKEVSFSTVLKNHHPDFILVNNCLDYSPSMTDDESWHQFIKNPHAYGYHYELVNDCPYYFLVRNTVYETN